MKQWLSYAHFALSAPWEHVHFRVRSAFDVAGAPGWHFAMPVQPWAELWVVREGTAEIRLGAQQALVSAPSVVLLRAGEARDPRHVSGKQISVLGFSFDAHCFGTLDFVRLLDLPLISPPLPALEPLVNRMVNESRERRPGYSLVVHGLGQLALVELLRAHQSDDALLVSRAMQLASAPELRAALQTIATRFDQPLDIAQLAQAAHLSPKYFGQKFRVVLGMTPMDYVRTYRLQRARDLLLASDEAVGTIAHRVGFESAAHFTRAFKATFGATPVRWREAARIHTSGQNLVASEQERKSLLP